MGAESCAVITFFINYLFPTTTAAPWCSWIVPNKTILISPMRKIKLANSNRETEK